MMKKCAPPPYYQSDKNPKSLSATTVLKMATIEGAKVLEHGRPHWLTDH